MNKYVILTVLITGMCSCSDMLDLQKDGRTTMDEIFTTRNGVRGYLNACYNYRPSPDYERSSLCDEAHDSDGTFANSLYSSWYGDAFSAAFYSSVDGRPWAQYYQGIRKCNVFIANMSAMPAGTILASEGELTGWVAQARTLRALYYLQLIKRYGSVPLITEAYTTTHDYSTDRKASFSEVIVQILKDCDDALAAPDIEQGFSWTISNGQGGIMTRAVAHAIKSQAVTYAASPLWADGTYTWEDATRINAEALYQCTTHDYALFTDTPAPDIAQNAYALYFITRPDEFRAYDKETIYGGTVVNIWQNAGMPSTAGQTKAGSCPTQELVDSYEMLVTGEPPVLGYSDRQHLNPIINTASGYDPDDPYIGRDPRFYASVYYNGAVRLLGGSGATSRDDHYKLGFATSGNNITITDLGNGEYRLQTTGGDPYVSTTKLETALNAPPPAVLLKFKYKSATQINNAQFFFAAPNPAGGQSTPENLVLKQSTEWTDFELDLTPYSNESWWKWGAIGHSLRFDVGSGAGNDVYVKDLEINVVAAASGPTLVETYVDAVDGISTADRRTTHTGYYLRKYNNWKSSRDNSADGAVRLFRLAEIYLNFAESAYQSHGPDVAIELGGGVSMSARDAVGAIRSRAGMPSFPAGMSKADFEKKYRNERRVELAFEEHRYFDVRRWKILEETERYMTGMRITQDGAGFNYTRIGFERGSWGDKYYLYPLDQTEVNKMQDHTGVNWQNPGWN
jgi:hypothetical protein